MADSFSSLRDSQRNIIGLLDEFLDDIEQSDIDETARMDAARRVEAVIDDLADMPWPGDA